MVFHDVTRPNAQVASDLRARFHAEGVRDRHLLGGRFIWSSSQLRLAASPDWDWVVLSWNSRYLSLPVALLLARAGRRKVALWGHGYTRDETRVRRAYRSLLARAATRVLLYSDQAVDGLPRSVRRRTVVVGNAQFRDASIPVGELIAPREGQLRLLHVGQLRSDRRLELAIDAVAELVARGWDATLAIVGDGPPRRELERRSAEMLVSERVIFAGPVRDEAVLGRHYAEADVTTCIAHGGLAVHDALEHGRAVVLCGTRSTQPPEAGIVFDRFPDLVDPTCTATGLADRFELAASDTSLPERVEAAADFLRNQREQVVWRFLRALDLTN